MDIDERKRHLAIIQSQDTRAAFLQLLEETSRLGLIATGNTGKVVAVRLHDSLRRYLFSWITNPNHLLFYIRKPALDIAPHLSRQAQASLDRVSENPAGEVTIRIEGKAAAKKLAAWLNDFLPLPE